MKTITRIFASMALVASFAFASCTGSGTKEAAENDTIVSEEIDIVEATTPVNDIITPEIMELAADEYLSFDKPYGYPIVVDFSAKWCGPCQQFAPIFKKAAEKYSGKIQFIAVDVDKCPKVASEFKVESIPYVLFVTSDGKISSNAGLMTAEAFDAELQKLL